jgi:cysteinyl-tRNA synthetase
VRNITDVGHLVGDADEGEDKVLKEARLRQLEPMEVVQTYTLAYHRALDALGVIPPSIEPTASGHVPEQIAFVERILAAGYGYAENGSVYFDLHKYAREHSYGSLSGRVLDDLFAGTRDTEGLQEKHGPLDFALWRRAEQNQPMQWSSPWGPGVPGWHIECSVMSTRYLGERFDIHGGGMDIQFPHHEAEIAQNVAALGHEAVRYWVHHGLLTINGQKMAKSLGNFITVDQMFTGDHPLLDQAWDPVIVRFFMLQTHYRHPMDFSNEPLRSAERGLRRLEGALRALEEVEGTAEPENAGPADGEFRGLLDEAHRHLSDDFNTPKALATLFDLASRFQSLRAGEIRADRLSRKTVEHVAAGFRSLVIDVLGLAPRQPADTEKLGAVVQLLIDMRAEARARKDYGSADTIRDRLEALGIRLKDGREGTTFEVVDR